MRHCLKKIFTYLKVSALVFRINIKFVEIEGILRDCGTLNNRRSLLLHERQQFVQEHPAIRIVVHLVQASQRFRIFGRRLGKHVAGVAIGVRKIQQKNWKTELKKLL
jgi:hypothetical protein